MEISEVLGRVGALGFLAVFQAIGVGFGFAMVKTVRDAFREGKGARMLPGAVFGLSFSLLFAGGPLFMAEGFSGWPGIVAQVAVLGMLLGFAFTPHPRAPEAAAAEAPRGGLLGRLSGPPPATGRASAGRWRRILSAAPSLVVAAGCVAVILGRPILGMTFDGLCHLVKVEFLVIHSFPFLSLITLPPLRGRWRIFQWFLFVTWSCLYLAFATDGGHGVAGLVGFATGAITTYLGFLLRWGAGSRVKDLVKRWGASFAFFMIAAMIVGAENAQASGTTLWHGAVYFVAVGLAEALGLYDLDWKRALARMKRRPPPKRRTRERAAEPVDSAR